MSFSSKKEFDRFFNRLDRPIEESRPDRFPSLLCTTMTCTILPCKFCDLMLIALLKNKLIVCFVKYEGKKQKQAKKTFFFISTYDPKTGT